MSKDYNPNLIGFFNLDRLPEHDKGTMTQRVISGEKGMAVWSRIKAGTHTPSHSHHNEQIMLITAGRMDFRLQGETRTCLPGDMILIPGRVLVSVALGRTGRNTSLKRMKVRKVPIC